MAASAVGPSGGSSGPAFWRTEVLQQEVALVGC